MSVLDRDSGVRVTKYLNCYFCKATSLKRVVKAF